MKIIALCITTALALNVSARAAEVTAKINKVHICCKSCVTGIEKAVDTVPEAKAETDQDAGTVTLTGPDTATVQKAAAALVKAGYFGKTTDEGCKIEHHTGATGKKVQSVQVEGVHLCCGKCVKAVDRAIKNVPGAKEHTAT